MMRLCLAVALLLAPATDTKAIFEALDAYAADGDAAKARAKLEKLGVTPVKLVAILRAGRPVEAAKTGSLQWKIKDAYETETDLYVTVPEAYDAKKPAGVMLLLHGLGGDGKQLLDMLYTKFAAENNLIIAAPTAQKPTKGGLAEDDNGQLADAMPHWWVYKPGNFVFAALSELKRKYAVDDDRVILSGYSMGGFGTWNIGLRYPDRFAALVPFAGGISRAEYLSKSDKKLRPMVENAKNLPVYFVHGDKDTTVYTIFDRKTRDQLKEFGCDYEYVEVKGANHMMDVREGSELMNPIQDWLKAKKREPHPKKLTYVAVGDYATGCWWARLGGKVEPLARLEAEVKAGNVIELTAKGADSVTLFLDEALIDLAKPVVVRSGGKELFRGPVTESLDAVLESWRGREDRALVYRARISLPIDK